MNNNQSATKGPIIANEGQPGGSTAAPPCCPDNPEARCGTLVLRGKKRLFSLNLLSHGKRSANRPLEVVPHIFCMAAGGKDGRLGFSQCRSAVKHSLPGPSEEYLQPLE